MSQPTESQIEACLRRVVREGTEAGAVLTLNRVRSQTEERLQLPADFFRADPSWKAKSGGIIRDAFEQSDEELPGGNSNGAPRNGQTEPPKSGTTSKEAKTNASTTVNQVNGVKRKSGDVNGSANGAMTRGHKEDMMQAKKKSQGNAHAQRSDESSSGSESYSSDSQESGQERAPSTATTKPGKQTFTTAPAPLVPMMPAKPLEPPAGYQPVDASLLTTPPSFSATALQGKQIWHITAPTHVPLSSLSSLALSSIHSGDTALTHRDTAYTLHPDPPVTGHTPAMLVPTPDGYARARHPITRTLHLRRKIVLPNLSDCQRDQHSGAAAAADVARAAVTTARPQPRGLRMRYKPPGFGTGSPGRIGSDSESADEAAPSVGRPSMQFPAALGAFGAGEQGSGREAQQDVKMSGDTEDEEKGPRGGGAESGKHTKGKESREERHRRKAEKRARKEARAKARNGEKM